MAQFTAYGRFFEKIKEIPIHTEVWVKTQTMNELAEEARVSFDDRKVIFNFGPTTESLVVEFGGFKQEGGSMAHAKVISAGSYKAPQVMFGGRSASFRIL